MVAAIHLILTKLRHIILKSRTQHYSRSFFITSSIRALMSNFQRILLICCHLPRWLLLFQGCCLIRDRSWIDKCPNWLLHSLKRYILHLKFFRLLALYIIRLYMLQRGIVDWRPLVLHFNQSSCRCCRN